MIQAGDLRERVTFMRATTTTNDYGERVMAWAAVYSCRARVQFKKGSRALGEGEVWNPTTVAVTARYAPSLGGGALTTQSGQLLTASAFWAQAPVMMAAGLRMRWRGQEYHVESMNLDGAMGEAVLTASAVELSAVDGGAGGN